MSIHTLYLVSDLEVSDNRDPLYGIHTLYLVSDLEVSDNRDPLYGIIHCL
jgi:hypothetical protein